MPYWGLTERRTPGEGSALHHNSLLLYDINVREEWSSSDGIDGMGFGKTVPVIEQ